METPQEKATKLQILTMMGEIEEKMDEYYLDAAEKNSMLIPVLNTIKQRRIFIMTEINELQNH